jgi:predicted ArsR family transcriptional regulator
MSDDREYRHHDDKEFLDAIRAGYRATSDIAEQVGVSRQAADQRLRQLGEEGEVESEMIGNSLIWSVAGD